MMSASISKVSWLAVLVFTLFLSVSVVAAPAPTKNGIGNAKNAQGIAKRFDVHTIHEARSILPSGWTRNARSVKRESKDGHMLPLRINLAQAQGGLERGPDILLGISHPHSPQYGNHLTPDEVAELFAPSDDAVDGVLAWLSDFGLNVSRESNYQKGRGAITTMVSMSDVEELLKTTYNVYEHTFSGTPHIACESYSIPASLVDHIDFITPTIHFDVPVNNKRNLKRSSEGDAEKRNLVAGLQDDYLKSKGPGKSPVAPKLGDEVLDLVEAEDTSSCDSQITPSCLLALYGINYTPAGHVQNAYGIVEYTPQSYAPDDMDIFFTQYAPSLVGARPHMNSIDGGQLFNVPTDETTESNLDLQYAMALVEPIVVNLYQTGDGVASGSANSFLDALDGSYCALNDPTYDPAFPDDSPGGFNGPTNCGGFATSLPQVVSTSYGWDEMALSTSYLQRQCQEYMKLGMLGITFVFSSGDYGVAGNQGYCYDPSNDEYSADGTVFNPIFPASCPWVTAVGATELYPGSSVNSPEGAANRTFHSGGGFSTVFTMPTYQSTAVGNYLKNYNPGYSSAQYNNSGTTRGYPDIAVNGVDYIVAINGGWNLVSGTSASSPVAGSMFTLINDARAAAGKKCIGFVNPTLYANPTKFNDIVKGSNPGCGTPGFAAEPGWDPVSGLGTPNFQQLMALFMS